MLILPQMAEDFLVLLGCPVARVDSGNIHSSHGYVTWRSRHQYDVWAPGQKSRGKPAALREIAHMRWWTTRGKQKTDRRTIEDEVLAESSWRWGQQVIHVWDRGFAGRPWLLMASVHAVRFVMRWPKHYRLRDDQGQLRKAW